MWKVNIKAFDPNQNSFPSQLSEHSPQYFPLLLLKSHTWRAATHIPILIQFRHEQRLFHLRMQTSAKSSRKLHIRITRRALIIPVRVENKRRLPVLQLNISVSVAPRSMIYGDTSLMYYPKMHSRARRTEQESARVRTDTPGNRKRCGNWLRTISGIACNYWEMHPVCGITDGTLSIVYATGSKDTIDWGQFFS